MQKELLKKISSVIVSQGGEKIIDILYKKKNVNELLISKKLNLTINQTRNILYKLLDVNLVKFIRKKDKKKGGWYTYYWTLNIKKSLELLEENLLKKIKNFKENLERRKNERFYFSPSINIEYTEEEALEHNFICPETGEVLQLRNNSETINQLNTEISKLKLFVEDVNKEVLILGKKEKKAIERKLKVETKKKEAERKARREKLKRKRKSLAQKKKPSKEKKKRGKERKPKKRN